MAALHTEPIAARAAALEPESATNKDFRPLSELLDQPAVPAQCPAAALGAYIPDPHIAVADEALLTHHAKSAWVLVFDRTATSIQYTDGVRVFISPRACSYKCLEHQPERGYRLTSVNKLFGLAWSERCTRAGLSRSVLDFLTKFNGWRIWSLATLERDDFEKLAPTPIVGTIVYILCQQFVAFHRRFLRAVEYEKSDLEKIFWQEMQKRLSEKDARDFFQAVSSHVASFSSCVTSSIPDEIDFAWTDITNHTQKCTPLGVLLRRLRIRLRNPPASWLRAPFFVHRPQWTTDVFGSPSSGIKKALFDRFPGADLLIVLSLSDADLSAALTGYKDDEIRELVTELRSSPGVRNEVSRQDVAALLNDPDQDNTNWIARYDGRIRTIISDERLPSFASSSKVHPSLSDVSSASTKIETLDNLSRDFSSKLKISSSEAEQVPLSRHSGVKKEQ